MTRLLLALCIALPMLSGCAMWRCCKKYGSAPTAQIQTTRADQGWYETEMKVEGAHDWDTAGQPSGKAPVIVLWMVWSGYGTGKAHDTRQVIAEGPIESMQVCQQKGESWRRQAATLRKKLGLPEIEGPPSIHQGDRLPRFECTYMDRDYWMHSRISP